MISKYVREAVKEKPNFHLKKQKTCFDTRTWTGDEVVEELQIN